MDIVNNFNKSNMNNNKCNNEFDFDEYDEFNQEQKDEIIDIIIHNKIDIQNLDISDIYKIINKIYNHYIGCMCCDIFEIRSICNFLNITSETYVCIGCCCRIDNFCD